MIKLDRFLVSSVVYPIDYKQLENKKVEVEGWFSRKDAIDEIEVSRKRFRESDGSHH